MSTPLHPRPTVTLGSSWRFPTPQVATLDNGVEVWAFDLPGQHVIALDVTLDAPLDAEPRDREGVGTIALRTSDEGSHQHPGSALAEALEGAGVDFDGQVGHRATACILDLPATRLGQAVPLLGEILTAAEHREADVARHVALRLAQIEHAATHGPSVAGRAVRTVHFDAASRRHRPAGGLAATAAQVTRDDVLAFRDRWWRPQHARVVMAGHFHTDPIALLSQALAGWQHTGDRLTPAPDPTLVPAPEQPVVQLVDRPGSVQVEMRVFGAGVDRTSPDWPRLQVATSAVGGSFLSRLNARLREELGYTYGIGMRVDSLRTTGAWSVHASVRTEVAADALAETLAQLDLTGRPLTEDEVADARNHIVGLAPLRYETASAVVGQASRLAASGLDADQVNRHFAAVARVGADEAGEAFVRHVRRGHVVLVGDADALRPQLEARGFTVSDLTPQW